MISLAFRMLFGDTAKYLLLISGIGFSTILMVQGMALFCGLMSFSYATLDNIRSPIWVSDPLVQQVGDNQPLRDTDISRVRSVPGVKWAAPLYVGLVQARVLEQGVTKQVYLVGLDSTTLTGAPAKLIEGSLQNLRDPDAVIVDTRSLELLSGSPERPLVVGDTFEMNDRTARIVATCNAAATIGGASYVLTTYDRAMQYAPQQRKRLSYILVEPDEGADPGAVAAEITKSTGLMARSEDTFRMETVWWMVKNSPVPYVMGIIVGIGFLVGIVISGQTFYNFVLENSRYLGALRAMGAETGTLAGMIVMQAGFVGVIGYCIGIGAMSFFFSLLPPGRAPLLLLWPVPLAAFLAILLICATAAFLGILRVGKLEPAIVFRS